jgi:hypothetical protein
MSSTDTPAAKDSRTIDLMSSLGSTATTRSLETSRTRPDRLPDSAHTGQSARVFELPDGWTIERVREVAQGSAELVADTGTRAVVDHFVGSDEGKLVRSGTVNLTPACVVDFSGLFLVQDADDGEWYMGQANDENVIHCWGSYGNDFEEAIKGL